MFLDNGLLLLGNIALPDFTERSYDERHQRGLVCKGPHFRSVLEEDAATFADGHSPGRSVSNEDNIGGNLCAQTQTIQGVGPGRGDAHLVAFGYRLGYLLNGRQNDATSPACIYAGITVNTLRYARKHLILAQAHQRGADGVGGAIIGKSIGEKQRPTLGFPDEPNRLNAKTQFRAQYLPSVATNV